MAEAWDWRRNYRVWEANRNVFLYPENWIEPDLRPSSRTLEELREVVKVARHAYLTVGTMPKRAGQCPD